MRLFASLFQLCVPGVSVPHSMSMRQVCRLKKRRKSKLKGDVDQVQFLVEWTTAQIKSDIIPQGSQSCLGALLEKTNSIESGIWMSLKKAKYFQAGPAWHFNQWQQMVGNTLRFNPRWLHRKYQDHLNTYLGDRQARIFLVENFVAGYCLGCGNNTRKVYRALEFFKRNFGWRIECSHYVRRVYIGL